MGIKYTYIMNDYKHSEKIVNNVAAIRRMALGYRLSAILAVACKYGVFESLVAEPLSASDLADRLKVSSEGIELLLNALVMVGLLDKVEGHYRNNEIGSRFLVPGKDDYQGGYIAFAFDRIQMWLRMEEYIRIGHSSSDLFEDMLGGNALKTEHFMAGMHANAIPTARFLISKVDFGLCRRILDVGGGTGIYSIELAKKYIDLYSDIIDLENVLPITKRYVKQADVENRVQMIVGDYATAESYGENYDAILMMAIIHQERPDTVINMFRYAYNALRKGGFVIASTFFLDEERTGPSFSVMFSLDLFLGTRRGRAYTLKEVYSFLKDAGFRTMEHMPISPGPEGIGLVLARK